MADVIVPLSMDQIALLSADEQEEYLDHLEALHFARGRDNFAAFVGNIEIPGTPSGEDADPEEFYCELLKPAAHHRLIIDALQGIVDGKDDDIDGVMIFMPPGSAKSSYASVAAPAWLLGRKPNTNVIVATYGQSLATRFGRRVRHVARSPQFEKLMGCTITGDNQAVDDWSLTNGSTYKSVGIGGAVTGMRADWLIIDDPIKNREEADSEVIREKTWASYNDDLTSRYKPNMKVLLIQTRWHEDDLAGRLLGSEWKGQSGLWRGTDERLWWIINVPLDAEHADDPLGRKIGEQLWPEYFVSKDFDRLRRAAAKGGTAARTWSSLYQQRPAPSEGSILRRADWKLWKDKKKLKDGTEVPDPPECDYIILSYDTAFEEDEDADFSAMTAWGIFASTSTKKTGEQFHHHHAILLGAWRDKVSAIDLADIIQDHYRHFKPDAILVEKRASGITVLQELKRLRLPVKSWLPRGKPGAKGKIPRAHGVAMMLEQGCVHYIPGRMTETVITECASFPYATNDDLVDSTTQALTYFRDRFMFRSADEEMDGEERIAHLAEKAEQRRMGRKLYGANEPRIRASNERHLYGSKSVKDDVDPYDKRLTDDTRRKIYGA
jgi:phage terminase large subunit-like protein